jgi:hypothetical protein
MVISLGVLLLVHIPLPTETMANHDYCFFDFPERAPLDVWDLLFSPCRNDPSTEGSDSRLLIRQQARLGFFSFVSNFVNVFFILSGC